MRLLARLRPVVQFSLFPVQVRRTCSDSADFSTLKSRLQLTDGNLSVHLRKLEDAGYVEVTKQFVDRKPLTVRSEIAENDANVWKGNARFTGGFYDYRAFAAAGVSFGSSLT